MRVLLILFALLPFLAAEDVDPGALRKQLQGMADELQRYAGEVARTATEVDLPVVPALLDRLRSMREELIAQAEALKDPKADTAKAREIDKRASELGSGTWWAVSQLQTLANQAKGFARVSGCQDDNQ